MTAWLQARAAELGRGIEAGVIDPRALAEAHLEAIAAHPDTPRIYAALSLELARTQAAAAAERARAGLRRGPLDGVPVSWKDLFDTAGIATEGGSALLEGRVPSRDARVVAAGARSGLVCLGKTHMSELAFSGLGLNPVTATPPCVNDAEAVPGGSSSGAAASVAFGLAAAAIGSDTGGSVRIPAAWNDLVGFKPTHGALSLRGVLPLAAGFDTVGPLARSVEDAALLMAALAETRPVDLTGAGIAGARLMVLETLTADAEEVPRRAFEEAVDRLARAGALIERRAIPMVAGAETLAASLVTGEAHAAWGETIEADPGRMFARIRDRFLSGREVSAARYLRDREAMMALRRDWAAEVAGVDAVILPAVSILPPKAQRLMDDPAHYTERNLLTLRNTRTANMLGLCAVTLPTGTPSAGLMTLGAAGGDGRLLRLAAGIERALAG